jgi:hypothetical protein
VSATTPKSWGLFFTKTTDMESESHFGRHAREKDIRYSRVPNDLIRNNKLSCEARVFIMWATSHNSSFVWTRKQAMDAMRVKSMTTFYKVVDELSDAKYLIKADLISSAISPASQIYMMYKVPYDSSDYNEWYDDNDTSVSTQVGVPKNDTTLVPNFDTTPVPKNGTLKNTIFLEQPIENIKKENIKRKKAANEFIAPTLGEVKQYFIEMGYSPSKGEQAFNYYDSNDWKDKNNKQVMNWKMKMQIWFKPEDKIDVSKLKFEVESPEQYEGFNKYRHYNEDVLKELVDGIWHYQTRPIGFKKG